MNSKHKIQQLEKYCNGSADYQELACQSYDEHLSRVTHFFHKSDYQVDIQGI